MDILSSFTTTINPEMTWKSFWRSVGHDVEHATHVADEGASVVKSLGGDVVATQSDEGAVKGAASNLSLPLTIGAITLGAFILMKR